MVATVSVYFDSGGADTAPGTSTDVDALGPPCIRFKNADNPTIDSADKLVIPAAGTIYSRLKHIYLYCDDADGHTLNNFKIYKQYRKFGKGFSRTTPRARCKCRLTGKK